MPSGGLSLSDDGHEGGGGRERTQPDLEEAGGEAWCESGWTMPMDGWKKAALLLLRCSSEEGLSRPRLRLPLLSLCSLASSGLSSASALASALASASVGLAAFWPARKAWPEESRGNQQNEAILATVISDDDGTIVVA